LEWRYLLEQNSYAYLFWNGAYYENRSVNKFIHDTPYGFGLGLSFETKAGIFSLNYAIGKQFNNPIDIRAAKVHFGLISFF
jgi:hemolysin activation/secretion protein